MPAEAAALTGFLLAGNTLLRPAVNRINRRPIDAEVTEAEYRVHVVCCQEHVSLVRDLLDAELDRARYPIREVETLSACPFGELVGGDKRPGRAARKNLADRLSKIVKTIYLRSVLDGSQMVSLTTHQSGYAELSPMNEHAVLQAGRKLVRNGANIADAEWKLSHVF